MAVATRRGRQERQTSSALGIMIRRTSRWLIVCTLLLFVAATSARAWHLHDASADRVARMGTAANLNYLAHEKREFRDLRVDALVTAGVEGNATRAGDPANR
jgi:hypothetical protein